MARCLTVAMLLLSSVTVAHAGTSNSLLDVSPDGAWLLAVNSDNGTVSVVDLKQRKTLREIKLGDKPEGVAWIGAGPLAVATVYRDDLLVFFNAQTGEVVKKLAVPDEPYGIVANQAGTRAWVTHEYFGIVTEIDPQEMKVVREMKVAPFIRGLALSPDERRLYVTGYYNATLYALDLASGKVVDEWPAQPSHNLARHVCIHPSRPKAYITSLRSRIEIADSSGSIFPILAVADLVPPGPEKRRKSFNMDTFNNLAVPTNPWESALSPDGKRLYVIYAGTNDMNLLDVIDDDYKEVERVGGRGLIPLGGQHPRAVRVRPDGKEVYVYNTLDFEVGVYDPNTMRTLVKIKV
jgi:YVTN family beta-propeller protein